jgi:hypothetical protein
VEVPCGGARPDVRCARWQILKCLEFEKESKYHWKRGAVLSHLLLCAAGWKYLTTFLLSPLQAYLAKGAANLVHTQHHARVYTHMSDANVRAVAVGSGKNTWVGGRWEMVRDTWESVVPSVCNLQHTLCDSG